MLYRIIISRITLDSPADVCFLFAFFAFLKFKLVWRHPPLCIASSPCNRGGRSQLQYPWLKYSYFRPYIKRTSFPMDECKDDTIPPITMLTLPIEILVYILSFLTARDKVEFRRVSRRLRSVCETPSLWREFVWPYYHTGDDICVYNVLKVCGQHVKRLSFPHHVTLSKLLTMLAYCSNVIELSLPTTKFDPKQLRNALKHMVYVQKLDMEWNSNIKQLLAILVGQVNLKELTIRLHKMYSYFTIASLTESWLNFWTLQNFVPQKINIVTGMYYYATHMSSMWNYWVTSNSYSPPGHTGHVKLYANAKPPLNLYPVLPVFQLDFGQSATSPYMKANSVGLEQTMEEWRIYDQTRSLLLTDCTYGGEVMCRAIIRQEVHKYYMVDRYGLLKFVTEFVTAFNGLYSKDLEQLSIMWPNLQRLDIRNNKYCLNSLQGLRAIANSCHNLQGLNLLGIPVTEVKDQTHLWEILSTIKLTHLAIQLCALLPSKENSQKLTALFRTFTSLCALETDSTCNCVMCESRFADMCISALSHFPSFIHCTVRSGIDHTTLQDILTSCKELKCLIYGKDKQTWKSLTSICCSKLQQLFIDSPSTILPDNFMSTISSNGGLIHVVLCVKSVTSEGVTVLVRNSPNLMMLHVTVSEIYDCNNDKVRPETLESRIKQGFSHRQLFVMGSYLFTMGYSDYELKTYPEWERRYNTDLSSLWDDHVH